MAKNKGVPIEGTMKKRRTSLGSGYAGNILKSLGYSARDVITEVMPNMTYTVNDARDIKLELNDALSAAAKKSKDVSSSAKSKISELKEKDIKDLVSDLKSGKIYNKDRANGDDSFNFDDFGFGDFDEDFDSGDVSSPSNVSLSLDIPEDNALVESQDITTATVSKSAEAITKSNRENSIIVSSSILKLGSSLTSELQSVHAEVAKISTVVPKSITEHAALSAKYYEDSIAYQKNISETLSEIKTLYVNTTKLASGSNKSAMESKLEKFNGLDLGRYFNLVKSQAKSTIIDNPYVSIGSMILDGYKNGTFSSDKSLGASGLNSIVKFMMGKGTKKAAGKLDDFIGNMFLPIGMQLGRWQDDWSNPVKKFFGDIFGIKASPNTDVDKSKYEKGAVAFDGKVHRAITDVIPTYLRMITSALTGKEEIAFDYEKGVYDTVNNIRKKFDNDLKKSVTNGYFNEQFDFDRIVDGLDGVSREQGKEIKDAFQEFLFNMVKSDQLVTFRKKGDRDDIAKYTNRNSDDPVVAIIREYFEGLYNQGKHSQLNDIFGSKTLQAKRDLENTVQKMMRDPTSSNYHLIDNGLYSSGSVTVSKSNELEQQLRNIMKSSPRGSGRYEEASRRLDELKRSGGLGDRSSTADTIKLKNTGSGLGLDKYGRTSNSYLRDILATLSTGIKVVEVGRVEGDINPIISHSNRVLQSLDMDVATFNASTNSQVGSDTTGSVTYDPEKLLESISSVLTESFEEQDAIDKIAKKFGDKNILGRTANLIRDKRSRINERIDKTVNRITGYGIDSIYGKRSGGANNESGEEDSPTGGSAPTPDNPSGPDDNGEYTGQVVLSSPTLDHKISSQFSSIGNVIISQIINPLKRSLFDEEEGLVTKIEDAEIGDDQANELAGEAARKIGAGALSGIRTSALGELDPETGEHKNGILSAEANSLAIVKSNISNWTHDLIYGTKDGKEKGLLSSIRSIFGESEDGKLNASEKAISFGKSLKDHFIKRSYEWSNLIFGEEEEGEEKKLDVFLGDMKGKKGLVAGAATVGVLGSFFLPGGPITGALIGAGIGIVKNSTQLKNVLFGEQDDDGERVGGIITKETMDYFKERGQGLKVGAGVGILGSFFLPGGPITGALIGSGMSIASKSEAFAGILYGEGGTKEDPTGGITKYIKDHYSKNKDVKSTFLDAGIGAGVGILGSFFLPGGPITGALIGSAANISVNSDKFKNWFFGEEDPDDGNKRKGGVFGEVRDNLTEKLQGVQDDLSLWITENITNPLKVSMDPIKKKAKRFLFGDDEDSEKNGIIGAIAKRIDESAFGELKKTVKKYLVDNIRNKFKALFSGATRLIGTIVRSPILAIRALAESGSTKEEKESFAKRIAELNKESRKKAEERKANRKAGKKSGGTGIVSSADETAENTKETAQATTNTEKIVEAYVDTAKEEHSQKMVVLGDILKAVSERKEGSETTKQSESDEDSATVATKVLSMQQASVEEDSQMAALQGSTAYAGSKGKGGSVIARIKGAASSLRARFNREDSDEEQRTWREKIANLLTRNTEGSEKHHFTWSSIFSKKGLITAGVILMAPLIIKAIGGIINFFKSGIGQDIANTLKSILGWVTTAFSDEGGISGMVNNASENIHQVGAGLGIEEGSQYVIDENTGAIKTDENGNLIKESTGTNFSLKNLFFAKKAHIDDETGEVTNQATYDHTTQMLGKGAKYATHRGIRFTGRAVNTGKKIMNSRVGKWVADKAETAAIHGMYAGDNIKAGAKMLANSKLGREVAESGVAQGAKGVIGVAKKFLKQAMSLVTEKFGSLLKKFGASGSGITKLSQKIGKLTSNLWDDTILKKFSPTIQKILAKMGVSTGSAFIAEVAFIGIGALSGATNPGELFEVNMDDVQNVKTKAVMIAISTIYKGIMGSSIGSWFDFACDVIYEVSGINLAKAIATFVLNLISGDKTEADLSQAQAKFDQRYDAAVEKQYEAWKKNQEESGQEAMSFEEFKASDLAMSRSDFNLETNKTLGKRLFDSGKKIGRGIVTVGKKAVAHFLPHKESVYVATDGTYYRKTEHGNYYDYYSPIGGMIATQVSEEEVMEKLKSGELTETTKWTSPKRFQKAHEMAKIIQNTFTDSLELKAKSFKVAFQLVKDSGEYWAKNIKEHGLFGAVKNAFTKKKKKGWFDVNGGYYVFNDEENAYNYYNANGDLVSEDVDKDEVEEMKLNGLLTESDIIEDSDAQKTVKDIKKKVSDLWKDAKTNMNNVLESVAKFFGIDTDKLAKEKRSKTVADTIDAGSTTAIQVSNDAIKKAITQQKLEQLDLTKMGSSQSATVKKPVNLMDISTIVNNGGKGSDESETTSSSGTVNGFSYYSQNDPRFKNQAYDLSNGVGGKMGERGCGPAAMSMVASQLTGQNIDPVAMANMATKGGYSISDGTMPEYFNDTASKLGLSSQSAVPSKETIVNMLKNGNPVIIQGQDSREGSPFTSSGHYVVGVGLNGDNVVVNDPRGREYSKQYPVDSILSGAQNMWGFSNNSISGVASKLNPFAALGGGVEGDMLNNFPYLLQGDTRWGGTPYTVTGDPKQTISTSACGPTSMAMVLRSFGNNVTPIDTADYSLNNGYRTANSGTSWGFFPSIGTKYGLSTSSLGSNASSAVAELQKGNPVIASMGPSTFTKGGHYIVLSGMTEDGRVLVNDPAKVARSNVAYDPTIFSKEGKQFWSFTKDGKGSINNVASVKGITSESLKSGTPMNNQSDLKVTEGSPDTTAAPGSTFDTVDTNLNGAENTEGTATESKPTSVLELLAGAASAFAKPIMNWIMGKDSNDSGDKDTATATTSANSSVLGGLYSAVGIGSSILNSVTGSSNSHGSYDSGIAPSANVSQSSVANRMVRYYSGLGYSKAAIAAIMGNAYAESKLDPAAIQGGGKGPAAGIFQWENYNNKSGRWKSMAEHAASKGKDWTDLDSQLEFGHMEMGDPRSVFWSGEKGMANAGATPTTYDEWKRSTNVELATRQFEGAFERAGKPHMDERIAAAKKYYELYQGGTGERKLGRGATAPKDPNLVQAAAKGGDKVTSLQDSNRLSKLEHSVDRHNEIKTKLEDATNPLLRKMVELLGYIVENTQIIGDGVHDLFNKETPTPQIIGGSTHNNIIPVPQKEKDAPKDMAQYNTAKKISAGVYLT